MSIADRLRQVSEAVAGTARKANVYGEIVVLIAAAEIHISRLASSSP